jgi:hypothetical protein
MVRFGQRSPEHCFGKGQFCGISLGLTFQVYEKLWLFSFSQITATAIPIQGWANFGPSTGFDVEDLTGGNNADSDRFDADSEGPDSVPQRDIGRTGTSARPLPTEST